MSPGKGARRLLSADGGVWSLNIAIVIASVALLAGPVQHLPEFDVGVHLPWWGLALGFLAAERCVVHLHFRRSAHSFSLGDLPLVFGLLFATADRPRHRRARRPDRGAAVRPPPAGRSRSSSTSRSSRSPPASR